LFTFETDQPGEMALTKDELVEVAQKDEAGKSHSYAAPLNPRTHV
jgi:predicted PP-loop superfamily ATPase